MTKCTIIAEAGVNHNGSVELAIKLVDAAADAGADIVKFQTFKSANLVNPRAKKATYQQKNLNTENDSQYDMLKKLELTEADHHILIEHCQKRNIAFLSTAFDPESLRFLETLNLPLYKIPSGEITNLPYLRQLGKNKKEILLSTGMATLSEIEAAIGILIENGTRRNLITVLHCNTEYPTPMEDVNLNAMVNIGRAFGVGYGYSDHTNGIEIPIAAVALGATVIEKHFTLDKEMEGPDHRASLEPAELRAMVSGIRNIERALGDGIKKPSESERKNIKAVRKSIFLASDVRKGQIVTEDLLIVQRPLIGISPMEIDNITGMKFSADLKAGEPLTWALLEA